MQDKYVGDIGDFGKYALLRFLANGDVVLGIVWYRTTAEDKSQDGMLVQYLFSQKEAKSLGDCDAELFNTLRRLVESKDRRVVSIRERGIFPGSTVFYEEPLDFALVLPRARPEARTTWCQNSLKKVDQAQLVFLDPDNGLALNERKKYRKTGPKYVFLDELRQYLSQGKSLIVYCHQDRRKGGLSEQVREGIELLSKESPFHEAWAFTFHRKSVRIYFVVPCHKRMALLLA